MTGPRHGRQPGHPREAPAYVVPDRPFLVSGAIGLVLVLAATGFALRGDRVAVAAQTPRVSTAAASLAAPIPTTAVQGRYVQAMLRINEYFGLDPVRTTRRGDAVCRFVEEGRTRAEVLVYAGGQLTGGQFQLSRAQVLRAVAAGHAYLCPTAPAV